jgi:hypothetical protein
LLFFDGGSHLFAVNARLRMFPCCRLKEETSRDLRGYCAVLVRASHALTEGGREEPTAPPLMLSDLASVLGSTVRLLAFNRALL